MWACTLFESASSTASSRYPPQQTDEGIMTFIWNGRLQTYVSTYNKRSTNTYDYDLARLTHLWRVCWQYYILRFRPLFIYYSCFASDILTPTSDCYFSSFFFFFHLTNTHSSKLKSVKCWCLSLFGKKRKIKYIHKWMWRSQHCLLISDRLSLPVVVFLWPRYSSQ